MKKYSLNITFKSNLSLPYDNSVNQLLPKQSPEWYDLVSKYSDIELFPSIESISENEIINLQNLTNPRIQNPIDLTYNFNCSCRKIDIQSIYLDIQNISIVENVEVCSEIEDYDLGSNINKGENLFIDSLFQHQTYFKDLISGVNLEGAWRFSGAKGTRQNLFVLGESYDTTHEETDHNKIINLNTNLYGNKRRDTGVLSLTSSLEDNRGMIGACPNLENTYFISYYDSNGTLNLTNAIELAIQTARQGDVILIHHWLQEINGYKSVPFEASDILRALFKKANVKGIIIVSSAGNSNLNLENFRTAIGQHIFDKNSPDFDDSGSILVGNAEYNHLVGIMQRNVDCNFGTRVSVCACGTNIMVADTLVGATHNWLSYGGYASAIIAGVACSIQGSLLQKRGIKLLPGQLRTMLTWFGQTVSGIGKLPDVEDFLSTIIPIANDVYIRDFIGDNGDRHRSSRVSSSPDIVVRQKPYTNPNAQIGEFSGNRNNPGLSQPVGHNSQHYIYVRGLNRTNRDSNSVDVEVFYSAPSTLMIPSKWKSCGRGTIQNIPGNNKLGVSNAIPWHTQGVAKGHYCFVAVLDALYDQAPDLREVRNASSFANFIRKHNNVAWRNFNVVSTRNRYGQEFTEYPAEIGSFKTDKMSLFLSSNLPNDCILELIVPYNLKDKFKINVDQDTQDPTLGIIRINNPSRNLKLIEEELLPESSNISIRYSIRPTHFNKSFEIAIFQTFLGMEIGRITWLLKDAEADDSDDNETEEIR